MTAPLFRLDPLPDTPTLVLAGDEGRHATTVRRLRPGERVDVTDGAGLRAECVVSGAERGRLELAVQRRDVVPPPSPRLVAVQALVKGERSELAVELLTEAGVDEIVPWEAARCVARWSPGAARRWSAALDSAAKQSRRVRWPRLAPAAAQADVIARIRDADLGIVLAEDASEPLSGMLPRVPRQGEIVIVVGPEGGITDDELDAFDAVGARRCRLGPTVLRASTAGLAAAAVLAAASGRW